MSLLSLCHLASPSKLLRAGLLAGAIPAFTMADLLKQNSSDFQNATGGLSALVPGNILVLFHLLGL
jgi:hypothetical protein